MSDWGLPWEGGCRCGQVRDPRAAAARHGLPLHGLPADELQRLFAERRHPQRRVRVIQGEPVIGGLHGAAATISAPTA